MEKIERKDTKMTEIEIETQYPGSIEGAIEILSHNDQKLADHIGEVQDEIKRINTRLDQLARERAEQMIAGNDLQSSLDTALADISTLRNILEWLHGRGGLGLDIHAKIATALAAPHPGAALLAELEELRALREGKKGVEAYYIVKAERDALKSENMQLAQELSDIATAAHMIGAADANDKIRSLEAERDRLRKALEYIDSCGSATKPPIASYVTESFKKYLEGVNDGWANAGRIARAALAEEASND